MTRSNFSFVKLGDGEMACMSGEDGANCDGHRYSPELARDLTKAFIFFAGSEKTAVVQFEDQKNYNCLLHRTDNNPSQFWKAVAQSGRAVVLVGPERLTEAAKLLRAAHIFVPLDNAFDSYKATLAKIARVEGVIYVFCAGMISKLLIADLMKENPDATYIDAGSAFDPLIGQTRTWQMTRSEMLSLYQDPSANFRLAQETHPERMWVLDKVDPKKVILDLGCGSNKTLPEATGMDIREGVTDFKGDITKLPFADKSTDIIISRHSFEHVLNPGQAMAEWLRVLRPNSKMLIVLPDHGSINTMDEFYSAGQHLHAYTMESFKSFCNLFPYIFVSEIEQVIPNWSFGAVLYCKLPMVTIIIPSLGRPEGLKRCKDSIAALNYPQDKIEVLEISGEESVPVKMKTGLAHSSGDIICYAANDMEFNRNSLLIAVEKTKDYGLVAFNTGTKSEGAICEHFIITKNLIHSLGGEIFDTRLHHCGVDNLLWAKAKKLGQAFWCEKATIIHHHFSRGGEMDAVYEKGWCKMNEDREKLKELMLEV